MTLKKLTLVEHIEELRGRIIKSVIFMIIMSCLFYNFTDVVLSNLVKSLGETLVFIAPAEAFVSKIKIALFGGLFLSSPVVIYQLWKFISQGLEQNEKKYALIFGPLSFVFFVVGSSFGYFIIIPIGVRFLLGFSRDFIVPMITVSKYISFVGTLVLAFGAIFQLPSLLLFLTKVGLVTPAFLSAKRKHAIVIIFILAAILTPPDVITQCLMAGPLLILYELGIVFSKFASRS